MLHIDFKIINIFVIGFSLLIIIFIISKIECNSYKLSTFDIKNNKNSSKLKIIFISDYHNKVYSDKLEKLLYDIKDLKPDYIILGGDFINFSKFQSLQNKLGIENTYIFISRLIDICRDKADGSLKGIYFSFGNHELRLKNRFDRAGFKDEYNKFITFLTDNNILLLDDNSYDIDSNVSLYGLSLYEGYYNKLFTKKTTYKHIDNKILNEYFKKFDDSKFNIISFHKPDYAEDLIDFGFDLVLSGHYHGGLINFPILGPIISPDLKFFPKYSKGNYIYKMKNIIVSSGLGEHFVKIRVNNRPEAVVINII